VLARVTTTGTDTSLASVLTEALRSDLVQSRVISLLPPSTIRSALTRMQRPPETSLTVALAREVAAREGARLVIAADVAPIGSGFVINAQLLDPATGDPLASTRATADGADELLQAVGKVTRALRERIGESLRSIQNSPRLERVTTPSFEAFRKYTEAIELSEGTRLDFDRAKALLLEAVALDSTFAMAYRKLGWLVFDANSGQEYFTKAFRHRSRLSDLERLQVEGSYYWLVAGDLDRSIDAHLQAARIDSTVPRTTGNLSQLYLQKHDYEQSLMWARRTELADSVQTGAYSVLPLLALRRHAEVDSVLARMARISGDSSFQLGVWTILQLWARERWDSLPGAFERMRRISSGTLKAQVPLFEATLALVRGRVSEGRTKFRLRLTARRQAESRFRRSWAPRGRRWMCSCGKT
jgi:tetratricopeptide (TPR) repeat protein